MLVLLCALVVAKRGFVSVMIHGKSSDLEYGSTGGTAKKMPAYQKKGVAIKKSTSARGPTTKRGRGTTKEKTFKALK